MEILSPSRQHPMCSMIEDPKDKDVPLPPPLQHLVYKTLQSTGCLSSERLPLSTSMLALASPHNITTVLGSIHPKKSDMGIDWSEVARAINAFRQYEEEAIRSFQGPRKRLMAQLGDEDAKLLLPFWNRKKRLFEDAIGVNLQLANAIAGHSEVIDTHHRLAGRHHNVSVGDSTPTSIDHAVVRSTIRQFWRDWSGEGRAERETCHRPVLEDLLQHFHTNKGAVRVLIPGAGLSRLAYNLACAEYQVDAIDVSYIQLLATNFILSCGNDEFSGSKRFPIFPFATQFSNHLKLPDQFTPAEVPDEHPATRLGAPRWDDEADHLRFTAKNLSLSAKDFNKDFKTPHTAGSYDAVATVFFVDTAKNFLDYARTVHHVLKPGGIWINVGPLLWNCYELGPGGRREGDVDTDEDSRTRVEAAGIKTSALDTDVGESWDPKIELSNEEVLALLGKMGFVVRKEEVLEQEAGYIQDPESMLQAKYRLAHWVAEKLPKAE